MQGVPVTGHPFRGQEPAVPTRGTAFFLGAQLVTQRLWTLSLCSELPSLRQGPGRFKNIATQLWRTGLEAMCVGPSSFSAGD